MEPLSPAQQAYQLGHAHEDRGPLVTRVSIALAATMVLVVALRFSARYAIRFSYGWDDFFCACGLVTFLCMCAINIISVHYGMGKHIWAVEPAQGYKIIQAGFFLSIDYALTHFTIKMALLFTYIRFFGRVNRTFRYAVWCVMFYVTAWASTLIIAALAQCRPLSYFWKQFDISLNPPAQGYCTVRSTPLVISTSALNLVGDFALLILPLPMLWGLQMPLSRKIGLLSIFLVGTFGCIAGIFRLTTTLKAVTVGADSTWNAATVYVWTAIESGVQLFCACVLVIWPLVLSVAKKVQSSIRSGSLFSSKEHLSDTLPNHQADVKLCDNSDISKHGLSKNEFTSSVTHVVSEKDVLTTDNTHIVKQTGYSVEVLDKAN